MNPNLTAILFGLVMLIFMYVKAPHTRRIMPWAFLIALTWTTFYRYEYSANNILLFNHINLFPLVLWTMGLTLATLIYDLMPKRVRFLSFVLVYWALLWGIESFGYYTLGIRLDSSYPDFFGTGVLHLPFYGQLFYVGIAPVFVAFAERYSGQKKIL